MNILLATFSAEDIYLEYSAYSLHCLEGCIKKAFPEEHTLIKYYPAKESKKDCYLQELTYFIKENNIQLVGFGCYIWNIKLILYLGEKIKEQFPGIKIILGGPQVMYKPEEMMANNPFIDIIVRGDGEETLCELVRYYKNKDIIIEEIKGITYKKDNEIISNRERAFITNLDEIPSPYITGLITIKRGYAYPIETSRGCVFNCSYCHWGLKKLRFFSMERVEKEIEYLTDNKVNICVFVDSAVNFDKERASHIIKFINKINRRTIFTMFQSIHYMDEEFIDLLNNSPNIHIELGIQTLNPAALKNIRRRVIKKEELEILKLIKRPYTIDLIYGLPGDKLESFQETFNEISKYNLNMSLFKLGVHPGTGLWEDREKYKIEIDENTLDVISNYTYGKEDVEKSDRFKKNYQTIFSPIFCSEFTAEEMLNITGYNSFYDLIDDYSEYVKHNFNEEDINRLKYSGDKREKMKSLEYVKSEW